MTNSRRAALVPSLLLIGAAFSCGIAAAYAGPSLDLESNDAVITPGLPCVAATCGAAFSASLSGPPFGQSNIGLCLWINPKTDTFTGCRQATGNGLICSGSTNCQVACPVVRPEGKIGVKGEAFDAAFIGELCQPEEGFYLLRGTLDMRPENQCASAEAFAASGTLLSFGAVHIPGSPVFSSDPSVASIIGSSGKVPMCTP